MKYELDYGEGVLTCWNCGEDMREGLLIEWEKGFKQEVNCLDCFEMLLRNEKIIRVVAYIRPLTVVTKPRGEEK